MIKKLLTVIILLTHILCVLLGYSLGCAQLHICGKTVPETQNVNKDQIKEISEQIQEETFATEEKKVFRENNPDSKKPESGNDSPDTPPAIPITTQPAADTYPETIAPTTAPSVTQPPVGNTSSGDPEYQLPTLGENDLPFG